VYEYVYTGVRKKEPDHTLWGKWFGRDDAPVVTQSAQLVHEIVILTAELISEAVGNILVIINLSMLVRYISY
jgi:hypothetical protein